LRYESGVSKIRVKMLGFVSNTKQKKCSYIVFSKKKKLRKTKCSCEGYGFRLDVLLEKT
jgi:hypothetical protein